jgi:hypothetical protein
MREFEGIPVVLSDNANMYRKDRVMAQSALDRVLPQGKDRVMAQSALDRVLPQGKVHSASREMDSTCPGVRMPPRVPISTVPCMSS